MINIKGFTLIETILYIGILSMVIFGIYFSLINLINSQDNSISENDYKNLIKNFHEK
jgi:type II secretory pathway pseudopilin PulG